MPRSRGNRSRRRAFFTPRLEQLAIDLDLLDDVGPLDAILATELTRSRYGKTDAAGLAVYPFRERESWGVVCLACLWPGKPDPAHDAGTPQLSQANEDDEAEPPPPGEFIFEGRLNAGEVVARAAEAAKATGIGLVMVNEDEG